MFSGSRSLSARGKRRRGIGGALMVRYIVPTATNTATATVRPAIRLKCAGGGTIARNRCFSRSSGQIHLYGKEKRNSCPPGFFVCALRDRAHSCWVARQGNWVRIGRNKYAFTAVRTIYDENGNLFGRAKNWGAITQISKDEYTGTMNVQFYLEDGTPTTPVFSGTLHSQRVAITFEQQQ